MDGPRGSKSDRDDSYEDITAFAGLGTFQSLQITAFAGFGMLQMLQITAFPGLGKFPMLQVTISAGLGTFKCCKSLHWLVLEHLQCCKLQYFKRTTGTRDQRTPGPNYTFAKKMTLIYGNHEKGLLVMIYLHFQCCFTQGHKDTEASELENGSEDGHGALCRMTLASAGISGARPIL